jgi:CyaY protein
MMDESTYQQLIGETFRKIEDAFEDVDPDQVEVTSTGDVVTLSFANGVRCILNTQRPVRQVWMAARAEAWHFDWDEAKRRWIDDRGRGLELTEQIKKIVKEQSGLDVAFSG